MLPYLCAAANIQAEKMPGSEKQPGIIVRLTLARCDISALPSRQIRENSIYHDISCRPDKCGASGNYALLRFGGFFANQTYLQVTRLMQRIHYLHQRLVIDGFIRTEEDGGVFLAFG